MYDPVTADLIRSSPALPGLDTATLPDRFADTFAQIATARIRLRHHRDMVPAETRALVSTMRRVAHTHEALLVALPDRQDRAAAAFVAATAHQLSANATHRLTPSATPTALTETEITSDVAAMLLFFIAEATADAAEVARALRTETKSQIERALVGALRDLAVGNWWNITAQPLPPQDAVGEEGGRSVASNALYRLILQGVHSLAKAIFDPEFPADQSPAAVFAHAQSLSVAKSEVPGLGVGALVSAFSGPHHLASLLGSASRDMSASAVAFVPAPTGLDSAVWARNMRHVARSRPLLWRNHRAAIAEGYLRHGVSSVVAFPTGAGKSTLADLKITAALLAGRKVVFLAPTNALVDQVANSLRDSLADFTVQGKRDEDFLFSNDGENVPQVFVMTPESCLTQMAIDDSVFDGVGLFIFDECHLLHPSPQRRDRRAVDAMLCLVNFTRTYPRSDIVLMSAMISNASALAGWIQELTERPCLALDLAWKPTRQLRGSVVYAQERVDELQQSLTRGRSSATTKNPPAAVRGGLTIKPHAFFSLKQTWATQKASDYALVPLLDEPIVLSANRFWNLTPNAIAVTVAIASAAAEAGVKTLAFCQTIRNAVSAAKRIGTTLGRAHIELNEEESRWLKTAVLELGGEEHLYLALSNGTVTTYASVHHGLLLSEERRLCESLYKRQSGLRVLAATSTVAQGINFPCELVIVGEDSRFDLEQERRNILDPQELLNAAGRAGRAGKNAAGIVLVVPGKVVGIDLEKGTIGNHWTALRGIFGQSDQCLEIDDPLSAILDRVHADSGDADELDRYAINRLASTHADQPTEAQLTETIGKTLGAHRARSRGETAWVKERANSAFQYLGSQTDETEESPAVGEVASRLGLPIALVGRLAGSLEEEAPEATANVAQWVDWFFRWLHANADLLEDALSRDNLAELFGRPKYEACRGNQERATLVLPVLRQLTRLWIGGHPLKDLELALGTDPQKLETCTKARRFAVRTVPDLAHLFGLPALLDENHAPTLQPHSSLSHAKNQLSRCTRIGLDSHMKAALKQIEPTLSRCRVHIRYSELRRHLPPLTGLETWDMLTAAIEQAIAADKGGSLG